MALAAADFTQPAGELTADLFPGAVLADLVAGWITQAGTRYPDADDVTGGVREAHVYARAYAHLWTRIVTQPADVDVDEKGGYRYTDAQRADIGRLRDYWTARRDALEPPAGVTSASPYAGWPSVHSLR